LISFGLFNSTEAFWWFAVPSAALFAQVCAIDVVVPSTPGLAAVNVARPAGQLEE
jgi:hypothetical protein